MDLTPGYRELRPPDALRDVVACLWVRVIGAAEELRVIPDACSDVIWQRGEGTTVVGPDTSAKLVGLAPGDVLVGMRFLPGAGGGVLGVPLYELRDLRVDVTDVDRAFDVDGDTEPREVVARFMSAAAGRRADPLVAVAARRLGEQDVGAVARDLGLSERQLRRRFHAAAGYGPKTLARVLRFCRFVDAIDSGRTDLAALAFDSGYADQAHLTREATRLAGMPPAALLRARAAPL
ncbi:MAG TPA: AraC family transcriptional regulator [Thermoleophilaceae bacterium]|nr:AraC family transcriptional regulator [Thermoleophilaceae bacterium]